MEKRSVDPWKWGEYTNSAQAVYQDFLQKHGVKQATTLLEVKGLFASLTVELEATMVR